MQELRYLHGKLHKLELFADFDLSSNTYAARFVRGSIIISFNFTSKQRRADPIIIDAALLINYWLRFLLRLW
jgi:hypothetical protein